MPKIGRYTPELADYLCQQMASGRQSMAVCDELGVDRSTVSRWRGEHPEFRHAYIQAFTNRCLGMAEEALEILDSIPPGADMAAVRKAQAQADLRKWLISRLVPEFREQLQINGDSGVVIVQLPDNMRGQLIDGTATMVEAMESDDSDA
jgi:hypothetical protein